MAMKMRSSGVVLFVCSGLLLAGGAILGGSAGWSLLRMSYYFWTSELGPELSAGVQLVVGAMLCLPACWLATLVPYHPRAFSLVATLMFLATAALLVLSVGLSALGTLARALHDSGSVNASMHRALARSFLDPSVSNAFASMQLELHCCGVSSPNDWLKFRSTLPPTCCNRWSGTKHDSCEVPTNTNGCFSNALVELRYYINSMTVLTSALIIILGVTLFATAYTLVAGVIERGDPRFKLTQAPALRIACLHPANPPLYSMVTPMTAPAPSPPPLPPQLPSQITVH